MNNAKALALFVPALAVVGLIIVAMVAGFSQQSASSNRLPSLSMTAETVPGNVDAGRAIFTGERKIEGFVPCAYCHYIEPGRHWLVGPNLHGIAKRAATRVPGMSAVEYLYESVRSPDAHVVKGLPPGTMFHRYDDRLMEEDVEDIVAYLMTL